MEIVAMRRWVSTVAVAAVCIALAGHVVAEPLALSPCAKFTAAKDEKASLFAGYIYGFLAARIGYRDEKRLTAIASKVRSAALDVCRKNQNASFVKVVDALTGEAVKKSLLPKL